MLQLYLFISFLVQSALVTCLALGSPQDAPVLDLSSTAFNESDSGIQVLGTNLSMVNTSSLDEPIETWQGHIPGTRWILDLTLFKNRPMAYFEVKSILNVALNDIIDNKRPRDRVRGDYRINDPDPDVECSFFVREAYIVREKELKYADVITILREGLIAWIPLRTRQHRPYYEFTFKVVVTKMHQYEPLPAVDLAFGEVKHLPEPQSPLNPSSVPITS